MHVLNEVDEGHPPKAHRRRSSKRPKVDERAEAPSVQPDGQGEESGVCPGKRSALNADLPVEARRALFGASDKVLA